MFWLRVNKMNLSFKKQSIWLSCDPIDFRKSIDGLCEVVQTQFDILPHQGIFIFLNNARNRVKILLWHTNGFMLIYKRFESGKLVMRTTEENKVELNPDQLNWLLLGVDWIALSGGKEPKYSEFI